MATQKPLHRKAAAGHPRDIDVAEEYLDRLLSSEDENLSPDEIDSVRESVDAIRRGEMTLAEFEEKYGL
jgi:Ca2+-binding EF-hand superfamily protein